MLGFTEVYDYVGSKMDWMAAGLPWEGTDADAPTLAGLLDDGVPTCAPAETVADVRPRMGDWPLCLVINEARIVLGLLRAEALGLDGGRPVVALMQEGPSTYRPHVPAAEMAGQLDARPQEFVVVTTLDGALMGVVRQDAVRAAAEGAGG